MAHKTQKKVLPSYPPMKRTHRMSFLFNDEEYKVLNYYIAKYKISNTSHFMRETLIRSILQQLDKDRPTLFD
jgi:hypothetical protein